MNEQHDDYSVERVFIFADTLADGTYLLKTETGSLVTEAMLSEQLAEQLERARRQLVRGGTLRITMETKG